MSFSHSTLPAELTDERAEQLIADAIYEAEMHFCDDGDRRPKSFDPKEVARAEAVQADLAEWVGAAEALLAKLGMAGTAERIPALRELDRTIALAECKLQIKPLPPIQGPSVRWEDVRNELRRRRSA